MVEEARNLVSLEALGEVIDEEVVISRGGTLVTCFTSNHPAEIKVGDSCFVKLNLLVFDDYEVEELDSDVPENIEMLVNGFAYRIVGRLSGGILHSKGLVFESEALESEYAYLDGKTISINVNRIGVKFLSRSA